MNVLDGAIEDATSLGFGRNWLPTACFSIVRTKAPRRPHSLAFASARVVSQLGGSHRRPPASSTPLPGCPRDAPGDPQYPPRIRLRKKSGVGLGAIVGH